MSRIFELKEMYQEVFNVNGLVGFRQALYDTETYPRQTYEQLPKKEDVAPAPLSFWSKVARMFSLNSPASKRTFDAIYAPLIPACTELSFFSRVQGQSDAFGGCAAKTGAETNMVMPSSLPMPLIFQLSSFFCYLSGSEFDCEQVREHGALVFLFCGSREMFKFPLRVFPSVISHAPLPICVETPGNHSLWSPEKYSAPQKALNVELGKFKLTICPNEHFLMKLVFPSRRPQNTGAVRVTVGMDGLLYQPIA